MLDALLVRKGQLLSEFDWCTAVVGTDQGDFHIVKMNSRDLTRISKGISSTWQPANSVGFASGIPANSFEFFVYDLRMKTSIQLGQAGFRPSLEFLSAEVIFRAGCAYFRN